MEPMLHVAEPMSNVNDIGSATCPCVAGPQAAFQGVT